MTTRLSALLALASLLTVAAAGCDGGAPPCDDGPHPPLADAGPGGAPDPSVGRYDPSELSMDMLTIRQREHAERANELFERQLTSMRDECGWAPDAGIVWASMQDELQRTFDEGSGFSFSGYCAAPIEALTRHCRNGNTYAADRARARIQVYRCYWGGEGGWHMGIYEGGRLEHDIDWEVATSNVDAWLDDNL